MMNVQESIIWGEAKLVVLDSPRLEAEVLLCGVLDCERVWIKAHGETALTKDQLFLYKKFVQERSEGFPVAYIVGYKDWTGMRLVVNEAVLIPRDETEVLCEYVLEAIKREGIREKKETIKILDIGTGSGAILCALLRGCAEEEITCEGLGLDISKEALKIARSNWDSVCERMEIKEEIRVNFMQSDLLEGIEKGSEWNVIVANLPYVPDDMDVSSEVGKEPDLALFSGKDGLDHYRRLSAELSNKSVQFDSLWIEFLPQQESEITEIFETRNVKFYNDTSGDVFFARIHS